MLSQATGALQEAVEWLWVVLEVGVVYYYQTGISEESIVSICQALASTSERYVPYMQLTTDPEIRLLAQINLVLIYEGDRIPDQEQVPYHHMFCS